MSPRSGCSEGGRHPGVILDARSHRVFGAGTITLERESDAGI
jgi:hypothetical protein